MQGWKSRGERGTSELLIAQVPHYNLPTTIAGKRIIRRGKKSFATRRLHIPLSGRRTIAILRCVKTGVVRNRYDNFRSNEGDNCPLKMTIAMLLFLKLLRCCHNQYLARDGMSKMKQRRESSPATFPLWLAQNKRESRLHVCERLKHMHYIAIYLPFHSGWSKH